MSNDLVSLLTIVSAIALGAMSPGPSFVVVAQTSLSTTPKNGRIAALGIGVGGLIFAIAATAGLGAVLIYAGPAFLAVKIAGGTYLVYLGIRLWRSSGRQLSVSQDETKSWTRTFSTALLTQLGNPKTIVVYGSVFASALPADPSRWLLITLPITVMCVEASWYLVVATAMSLPRPRRVYFHWAKLMDRVAGATMGGLGALFAVDGVRAAFR